jgi:hypothetical protein
MSTIDFVAISGRPLAEFRVADRFKAGIAFRDNPSKPRDNRARFPDVKMNDSAWQEIRTNNNVLDGFSWVNRELFGSQPPKDVSAAEVRLMASIAIHLPLYLASRVENPIDPTSTPDALAEVSKSAHGILRVANEARRMYGDATIVTPQSLYHEADSMEGRERPLLVGEEEMCPVPGSQIKEFLKALMYRTGGDPARSNLSSYFQPGEFYTAAEFGVRATEMHEYADEKLRVIAQVKEAQKPSHSIGSELQEGITADVLQRSEQIKTERMQLKMQKLADAMNKLIGRTV